MVKHIITEDPTILEAVDNLSSMAELDIEEVRQQQKDQLSAKDTIHLRASRWLDPKDEEKTIASVKGTLKVVHKYLEHIYTKEGNQLKDKDMQKGVKSIISLATEAAKKIDACTKLFQGKGYITQTKEYQDLIRFYEKKILRKFEEVIESEAEWEEERGKEEDAADIKRRGLKDLETVTRDRDYELFFIGKEDGSRFYTKNLIRHIRLVADFDQIIGNITGEDPLLRIRNIQDIDMQRSMEVIKEHVRLDLDRWIKKAGKFREDPFIQQFYRAVMALLLSSNHKNIIGNTMAKHSLSYFVDFQNYLRETLSSVDYKQFIENPPHEMEFFYEQTLKLIHKVCYYLFLHRKEEGDGLALVIRIIQKEKKKGKAISSLSLWNQILDDHESLHKELQKYPSGPLFKVLDILHDGEDLSFDPYMQEDRPTHLFVMQTKGKKINVLRMACPTKQKQIDKADLIPEFSAALRHVKEVGSKVLIINLQDRTSWKDYARCLSLEKCQKYAEFTTVLDVVTLPKDTDFYFQGDLYIQNDNSKEFLDLLLMQFKSEEECGFSFPKRFNREELNTFGEKAIAMIYTQFFGGKEVLSRKNRLDFIEIFYQFIYLKVMQLSGADHVVFSAKDTVDYPSTTTAGFYAFLKAISGEFEWKEEEKDFIMSLVFLPALLIRERAVDIKPLSRIISMLSVLNAEEEVDRKKIYKEINKLFVPQYAEELHVKRDLKIE
jgi:hypothetical protein